MLLMVFPAASPKTNKHAKGESTVQTAEQNCVAYSFILLFCLKQTKI